MISYIISHNSNITIIINNKPYVVAPDHVNHNRVLDGLKAKNLTEEELINLVDIPKSIKSWSGNTIEIISGQVLYKGKPLHTTLTQRMLALMDDGFDIKPLCLFLENLMNNPSNRAVEQLYSFLENKGLPITEDGCFLAYKSVRTDWMDIYSGTFNNNIGAVVKMERNQVDDDRTHECSNGLHVGAMDYVNWYGGNNKKVIIVKVNPKDCVSVPRDHNATKLRVCEYTVLGEMDEKVWKNKSVLEGSLYTNSGENLKTLNAQQDDIWDDSDGCEECGDFDHDETVCPWR